MEKEMQKITLDEDAKHNTTESAWLVIADEVYDVTKFLKFHPGGAKVMLKFAGKDATDVFYSLHRHEVSLQEFQPLFTACSCTIFSVASFSSPPPHKSHQGGRQV